MRKLTLFQKFYLFFLFIGALLFFFVCIVAGIPLLSRGEWRFDDHVEISEFALCQGQDPSSGMPINPRFEFSQDIDHLFACGKLQSNIPVYLLFYWFDEEDKDVIYHNIDDTRYVTGYFSSELPLNKPLKPGKYRVDVYYNRVIIASAQFKILSR
jgi:hypothetical protein